MLSKSKQIQWVVSLIAFLFGYADIAYAQLPREIQSTGPPPEETSDFPATQASETEAASNNIQPSDNSTSRPSVGEATDSTPDIVTPAAPPAAGAVDNNDDSGDVEGREETLIAIESDEDDGLLQLSLEELLDMEVTVASGTTARKQSRSPGIITVVTAQDIQRWGARDLTDVLRMIPGFDVGYDTAGALGIGIRGNWATEGKVLILVDGIKMNEPIYGAYNIGHRFPVELIDRIEIIRGPGSAMYGGEAELGVVSIHTVHPQTDIAHLYSSRAGFVFDDLDTTLARSSGAVYAGGTQGNVSFGLSAAGQIGRISSGLGTDIYGYDWDSGEDKVSDLYFNGYINVGDFTLRAIVDRYEPEYTYSPDAVWDDAYPDAGGVSDFQSQHLSVLVEAQYQLHLSDEFVVTPRIAFRRQAPWKGIHMHYDDGAPFRAWDFHTTGDVYSVSCNINWNLKPALGLSSGVFYDYHRATDHLESGIFDGKNSADYHDASFFVQAMGTTHILDYAAGGRVNLHSTFGISAVPRFALTKTFFTYFHAKLLAAMAYKAPTVINLALDSDISPERSRTLELELGANLRDVLSLNTNLFFTRLSDAIIYRWDEVAQSEVYGNGGIVSSTGLETTVRFRYRVIAAQASWSMYHVLENTVDDYSSPDDARTLGFATHKLTSAVTITPVDDFYLTPSVVFLSPRWAVNGIDWSAEEFAYREFKSQTLLNFTLLHKNLMIHGLDLSLSVHNILNASVEYIEPYSAGYEPWHPGPGREFVVQLMFTSF